MKQNLKDYFNLMFKNKFQVNIMSIGVYVK